MSVQNIRREHTQKMFVNFEGEVEQFETLGFQLRVCCIVVNEGETQHKHNFINSTISQVQV